MDEARRHEGWYKTPFGQRADRVEKRILSGLLSDLNTSESILEVGCGTGHFTSWWLSLGLETVGLDIDLQQLQFAHEHTPSLPIVHGDAVALPFRTDSFDVVAMMTAVEFMASPRASLAEAARVARKGLVLGVLNSISPIMLWRRLRKTRAYAGARRDREDAIFMRTRLAT